MGLIFFTYFFAVSLFVNSSYLAFHKSNRINVLLNKITVPASLVALCIAVSIHLVFYQLLPYSLCCLLLIILSIWLLFSLN